MTAYKCEDCGEVFDESDAVIKGNWETGEMAVCPKCGSENLKEEETK